MPFGMGLQHRSGPTAHLVDIVDLPRGVVQVGHRRRGEQDIVMVGRTPHERGDAGHGIADLEAQPLNEESLRPLVIGRAEHDVTKFARMHLIVAQDALRAHTGTRDAAREVVTRCRSGPLNQPVGDLDSHRHLGTRVTGGNSGSGALDTDTELVETRCDSGEVVVLVDADADA